MSENNQVENTNEEMKSVDAEKICVKCKNIIPEESDFCIKCGAPVKKATEIPQERICQNVVELLPKMKIIAESAEKNTLQILRQKNLCQKRKKLLLHQLYLVLQ